MTDIGIQGTSDKVRKPRKRKVNWSSALKRDLMVWKDDETVIKSDNITDKTKSSHSSESKSQIGDDLAQDMIPPEVIKKYTRGPSLKPNAKIADKISKHKILQKESHVKFAEVQAAKIELLHSQEKGFVEADRGELTNRFTQAQLKKAVDITSAAKQFNLDLAYGPYRLDYTRNGRHLVIGGKKGHIAAFDWITKSLKCEINVMESVYDVQWLHRENLFGVAQKDWLYVYDNQGTELHCLKSIKHPLRLTFLPYHFLLAASTEEGYLHWLDVSTGTSVNKFRTPYKERLSVLTQNPYNALLVTGNGYGVVKMWSPNVNKPLVKQLCHKSNITAIAIDPSGNYMATGSLLNDIRIWDLRNLGQMLHDYHLKGTCVSDLSFSQTGLLAASMNNIVEVYKETHRFKMQDCYLRHRTKRPIFNIEYCPYEDILGIGTTDGFTSMLVPGSGESNFDGLEVNPVASSNQIKEMEVKSLLEKIRPEMITLDPTNLLRLQKPTEEDKIIAIRNIVMGKAPKIDFIPKKRKKRHMAPSKVKEIIKDTNKKAYYNQIKGVKNKILKESGIIHEERKDSDKASVLDRFNKPRNKRQPQQQEDNS